MQFVATRLALSNLRNSFPTRQAPSLLQSYNPNIRHFVRDSYSLFYRVYYKDLWHLFYQHQPAQLQNGPMHWGHPVSRDLAHWEHWPVAIYPDELGTIWSGSAAVHEAELVACFTQGDTKLGQI